MEVNCITPETCVQREVGSFHRLTGKVPSSTISAFIFFEQLKGTTPAAPDNGLTTNPVAAAANNPSTKEDNGPEHLRKIFVGGLSTQTTAVTVRKFFEQFGAVADAVVMRDPVTNHSRGFGFVTYVEPRSVENVQRARPHCIDNK